MKGLCLIISGGEFCRLPEDVPKADFVIACDRGWQHAQRLGISPDLIVGDFDSSPLPDTDIPLERAPTRKDDTDTMLAVRRALEAGYRELVICCAFGGRMDHTMANLQTAAYIAAHGGQARVIGADTEALTLTGGRMRIPCREGWSLSVFSLTDRCAGVEIQGTKYTCENAELTNTFPLGVSNVWAAAEAEIAVQEGILLIIQSKLRPGEHI